jgi:hypothetical protein
MHFKEFYVVGLICGIRRVADQDYALWNIKLAFIGHL